MTVTRERAREIIEEIRNETLDVVLAILQDHDEHKAAKLLKEIKLQLKWGPLVQALTARRRGSVKGGTSE